MNGKNLMIAVLSVFMGLMMACDATVHEYPVPDKSFVVIEPNVDRLPPLYYKEVFYDEEWNRTIKNLEEAHSKPYVPNEDFAMRIILDVYEKKSGKNRIVQQRTERRMLFVDKDALPPQDTIQVYLPKGDYQVLAWADYIYKDNPVDLFYQTDVLMSIKANTDVYPVNTHHRSTAVGQEVFTVGSDFEPNSFSFEESGNLPSTVIPVMMERPSGRYRVIASDFDDFIRAGGSLEGLTVKVIYKQYIGVGYNVEARKPNLFTTMYSFNTIPSQIVYDGKEAISLFGDYLFTDWENETNILADFYFFDASGTEISHCQNIEIPLKRNHETVLRGFFLTRKIGDGNNVNIDDSFGGEYVVEIN
ncbi:DUF6562 domain-containing protein [uncultured Coprobacter sp.]|jgi:hypothetical protein|uniref:DUF6562 domain-containing protein n=1 Tax=uncultured Coprobacter sp. TaxID=1720550 RepID=UPI0025D14045|nr:DUF6562 domain-containing protein [uncultured Coprobacter sp.]